ncbi:MAG: NAD-dependent protein deacetylase [Verrucomicrobiales bacterium]|nr:NAD-dependent protein deacetylase [Verrucomicrobiales bacterium]
MNSQDLKAAREALQHSDCLLITAGAGMGVDSGLPDFRGPEGFWNAYPPYRKLGFGFMEMANPERFVDAPELGWGFYGHRLNLYRKTEPHPGFQKLLAFEQTRPMKGFVFTSNVDGHFQRSGFNQVVECHGSILHLQCFRDCNGKIWPDDDLEIEVDPETMRAISPLPKCADCGGLARPAILMFGDWGWNPKRTTLQELAFESWLDSNRDSRLVILEFGAGTGIPTVRYQSEQVVSACPNATLVRINPREPDVPSITGDRCLSLSCGALEAIEALGL